MPDFEDKIIRNGTLVTMFFLSLTFVYKGILALLTNRKSVRELKEELKLATDRIQDLEEERERDREYYKEKLNNHHAAIDILRQQLFESKNK
jgi:uncharacterized protein (DUF3084 family)